METAPKHRESWKEFLKRKQINFTVQTYFIDALGAMAFGLFASLLIGTIFSTIGEKTGVEVFNTIASYAKGATGAALGVSIAYALKRRSWFFPPPPWGSQAMSWEDPWALWWPPLWLPELEAGVKETRVDILVTPGVTIISGVFMAQFVGPGVSGS
ncbi:MAG: PTS sugar transporter subunit IIC [Enterocloster sp.]